MEYILNQIHRSDYFKVSVSFETLFFLFPKYAIK